MILIAIWIGMVYVIASSFFQAIIHTQTNVNTTVGIRVYADEELTTELTTFQWNDGNPIDPGSSVPETIYIKNTGTISVTLSLTTSAWDPEPAQTFTTVLWDIPEGTSLSPGATMPAIITMKVASNIIDIETFNFDILVTGTS